ncbi:MAG: hypothetical protein ACXVRN_14940 [Solirubrobacteraceae bacterium]
MGFDLEGRQAALIFTPTAQRMLALALLQAEDERILPTRDDWALTNVLGMLHELGLLDLVAGGYVATDLLRDQVWAQDLRNRPFPEDDGS